MTDNTPHTFSLTPAGRFELANQARYFGGWPTLPSDPAAIVMAFPIEGSESSAAVVLRQRGSGVIEGEVHRCPQVLADRAMRQALAAVSLDLDGSGGLTLASATRSSGDCRPSTAICGRRCFTHRMRRRRRS
jgi:hypothetical protein